MRVALFAAALLIPAGVAAAAKTSMTLQRLSSIVQNNTRPMAFDLKAEGSYDGYAATVTVHGVQGATDASKLLETEFGVEIDAKMQKQVSAHLDLDVKVVGRNAYVRVNDFTMRNAGEIGIDPTEYAPYMEKWIRFPIDESVADQLSAKGRMERTTEAKRWAPYFDIVETDVDGMKRYIVSIPPAKQRRLLTMLMAKTRSISPKFNAEARRNIRNTTITLNAVVDLLADGLFGSSSVKNSVTTKFDGKKATFSLEFVSKTVSAPIITAPTNSVLLEEIADTSPPTKNLAAARNAQRRSDVNTILNATYQYVIDNNGSLPTAITSTETEICRSLPQANCTGLINLNVLTGSYIIAIPADPQTGTPTSSKYTIFQKGGRITVTAPSAEEGQTISVTR